MFDAYYIESISRLGRSTKDLLNIIDTLTEKGVTFISHKENIDTDTPSRKFMPPCSLPFLSWSVNSSNSNSVRASRLLRHRASTRDGNPLRSTGRGSGSSMGNGSPRTSQAGTLCGEWACQLIPFTAV
ncbi:MAG: recombinase family protein [Firmicutes bacterium]|nr:recombinase family protein [Bacillota bacterium]